MHYLTLIFLITPSLQPVVRQRLRSLWIQAPQRRPLVEYIPMPYAPQPARPPSGRHER
jgi:hypothetical protein